MKITLGQTEIDLTPEEIAALKTSALEFLESLRKRDEQLKALHGRIESFFRAAPVFSIASFMQFVKTPKVGYSSTYESKGEVYWISGDTRLGEKSFNYLMSNIMELGLSKEKIDQLANLSKKEFGVFTYKLSELKWISLCTWNTSVCHYLWMYRCVFLFLFSSPSSLPYSHV